MPHCQLTQQKEQKLIVPISVHGIVQIVEKGTHECCRAGSGTLVGPKFVLTAANILFENDSRNSITQTERIRFIPAANTSTLPFEFIRGIDDQIP
mgnify:CR=1 FL=1